MKRIFRMDADHPRKKTIQDTCGLMLLKPNATRWNLVFLSVGRIVRIMHEKGEEAAFNVQRPRPATVRLTFKFKKYIGLA